MSKKSNKYAGDPPKQELVGANPYLGLGRPIDLYDGVTRIAMLCTRSGASGNASESAEFRFERYAPDIAVRRSGVCGPQCQP